MAPKYTLSDSESEADAAVPSDKALDKALRNEVVTKYKAKNWEELTVKRVRRAVEEKLGLEQGFFKNTGNWKTNSEDIIKDEFVGLYILFNTGYLMMEVLTRECD